MHAFCDVRKKFLQTCETFSPSEQSFRRHACLLRRPQKVPADLRNIFAVRTKFPQACMPFKTSAKSSCSCHHLFRDRKVFCSAAPTRRHERLVCVLALIQHEKRPLSGETRVSSEIFCVFAMRFDVL